MKGSRTTVLVIAVAALAAGCGGGSEKAVDPEVIEGTWTYELTREYLLDNGISEQQATNESGRHTAVLRDGRFSDKWRTDLGKTGMCSGKYVVEGSTVSFYWQRGCVGDWTMNPSLDGNQLTWSDVETLDPNATEEDEKVNEVFNSVAWTRASS